MSREALTDDQLYAKLLAGAKRVNDANERGITTAGDSADCDYGHDLIEEVLVEYRNAAFVAGMAAARRGVVTVGWEAVPDLTLAQIVGDMDKRRDDAIRFWERGEKLVGS